eukprot:gene28594-31762_t
MDSPITGTRPTVTAVTSVNQTKFLAGGDVLTITGTLFATTSTISIGGTRCYAAGGTSITFTSATSISCVAPAMRGGSYAVVVTNIDTGYSMAENVTVTYQSATPPTVTLVSPTTQLPAGGNPLTITGTAFVGSTVTVEGMNCPTVETITANFITCIAPAMEGGMYAVEVTNADTGFSEAMDVVVTYNSTTPPVVTAVAPIYQTKHLAGGDILTISGTSFVRGTGLYVMIGDSPCSTATYVSATTIICVAPAMMAAGNYSVEVTNPDTRFRIAENVIVQYTSFSGTSPTVSSVSPIIQPKHVLGGDKLTITGTLFAAGATVSVGGTTCPNVTVVSATSITCIAHAKPAGEYAVVVTNLDTGVFTSVKFLYVEYLGTRPVVTAASPLTLAQGGGSNLTITGTLFAAGASVMVGETACPGVVFMNATTTSCSCIAPAKLPGIYAVVVTNLDTGYSMETTVVVRYLSDTPPIVTAVSPITQANNLSGGDNLTITSSAFVNGSSITIGGTACINVTF